jgi:exodeoxyribonuclease-1
VLAPAKTLTAERAAELGIDRQQCLQHLEILRQNRDLVTQLVGVYQQERQFETESVADYALYQGFISASDQRLMAELQQYSETELAIQTPLFQDDRLNQLWPLFKARNFAGLLSHEEMMRWRRFCTDRLNYGENKPARSLDDFVLAIENLVNGGDCTEQQFNVLKDLYHYYAQQ